MSAATIIRLAPCPAPDFKPYPRVGALPKVNSFPRFLLAGMANTGLTYALYLGLLLLVPYAWAYSVTYAVGILFGYLLNAYWVFRQKPALRSASAYPVGYVLNYFAGLGLLWLLVEKLGVPKQVAPLAVLVFTTPLMYLTTRLVFRRVHPR